MHEHHLTSGQQMVGIAIKAGFTCSACEGFVPLNAFVLSIRCPVCGRETDLTLDHWRSVLEDAIQQAPRMNEGEGRRSTIYGALEFRLEYGRLQPRYSGTDEPVSTEDLLMGVERGFVQHPETGERTPVRAFEDPFDGRFPGVVALAGEETSLLPGKKGETEVELEGSSNPVAFQCPACGGSLVVSGRNRRETCGYCGTEVTLPDGLWRRLHPVGTMERWFLLFDPSRLPFSWEHDILGAVGDRSGNLVLVVSNTRGDRPLIACVSPDRKVLWSREDLDAVCSPDEMTPGAAASPDGRVLLMHGNGRDLISVSMEDGSLSTVLEGAEPEMRDDGTRWEPFTMEEVVSFTCQPDGSVIVLRSRYGRPGHFRELLRFDSLGHPLPLWGSDETSWRKRGSIFGFLRKLFMTAASYPRVRSFDDLGDLPARFRGPAAWLASGADGSLYLLCQRKLAAFDPDGIRMFSVELPCRWVLGGPQVGSAGDVFVLGEDVGDDYFFFRVSPEGSVTKFAEGLAEGLDDPRFILPVLAADGRLHALGHGGSWKVLHNGV